VVCSRKRGSLPRRTAASSGPRCAAWVAASGSGVREHLREAVRAVSDSAAWKAASGAALVTRAKLELEPAGRSCGVRRRKRRPEVSAGSRSVGVEGRGPQREAELASRLERRR
jgi:hypothetical protein